MPSARAMVYAGRNVSSSSLKLSSLGASIWCSVWVAVEGGQRRVVEVGSVDRELGTAQVRKRAETVGMGGGGGGDQQKRKTGTKVLGAGALAHASSTFMFTTLPS